MEIFSGVGIGPPEKAIPPDITAVPLLPRKSKSTGRENVGKAIYAHTHEEAPILKVQEKSRKHHAVDQQEDIPHGERPVDDVHFKSWEEFFQKRTGMSMKAVTHTESPWEEYVRRVNDARPKEEDIPHGVLVNGVVITLPRPRCKRETLSPQEIKPIHEPTRAHRSSREEAIQKSPNWSMETAMQTAMQKELAAISQKMMDTLRKAQEETNSIMCREMQHIKTKINRVEHKQESNVKELKDSIQEVKQGNVTVIETLDDMQSDSNQKALPAEAAAVAAAKARTAAAKARTEAATVTTSESNQMLLNQMLSMLLKDQKLTEEHKMLAQQKAEERAIAEKRAAKKTKR